MHLLSRARAFKGWSLLLGPTLCVAVGFPVGCNSQEPEPSGTNAEAGNPAQGGATQIAAGSGGTASGTTFPGGAGAANAGGGAGPTIGTGGASEGGQPSVAAHAGGEGGASDEGGNGGGVGVGVGEAGAGNAGGFGGAGSPECSVQAGFEGTGTVPIQVSGPGVWAAWRFNFTSEPALPTGGYG